MSNRNPIHFQREMAKYNASRDPEYRICPVTHRGAHYILVFQGALVCVI